MMYYLHRRGFHVVFISFGVSIYIYTQLYKLVVSTHLKNISQVGSFPQVGMKIKNV